MKARAAKERDASMPESKCSSAILTAWVILVGFGCGSKDQPIPLEGTVLLDGQPVAGAIVSFLPDERGGRFATGTTAQDGSFRLTTYKENDGALAGDYRVTVTLIPDDEDQGKEKPDAAAAQKAENGKNLMAAMMKIAAARQKALEKSPVPALYRDGGRTPLRQIVPAKGKVVFALKRDPPLDKPAKTAEPDAKQSESPPILPQQPARP
jgi:hypothetical protein